MIKNLQFFLVPFCFLMTLTWALCQTKEIKKTFTVVNDGTVVISDENVADDNCYFSTGDGAIDVTVSGGVSPYLYEWFDGGGVSISADESLNNLLPGNYSLTVTDQTGCSASATFTVGYYCPYSPCIGPLSTSATNATDCSSGNGEISASLNGTGPYTYQVLLYDPYSQTSVTYQSGSQPAGVFSILFDYTSYTVNPGEYSINVEDLGTGCSFSETVIVGNDAFYLYDFFTGDNTQCDSPNGSIAFNIIDPVFPANFLAKWKRTEDGVENSVPLNTTGHTFTDLQSGFYLVQIEDLDNSGCVINTYGQINNYMAALNVTLDNLTHQTHCSPANGAIAVTVSGGSGSYDFWWSGPITRSTEDISTLPAGDYNIDVVDLVSGCRQNPSTPTFTIDDNTVLPSVTISATDNTSCSAPLNGAIDLTPSGTPGPYSFEWTNNLMNLVSNLEDPSALKPGDYNIVVTDQTTGCAESIFIGDPSAPSINDASDPDVTITEDIISSTTCIADPGNGEIDLTLDTNGYSYTLNWSGPGGFTSTTEDLTGLLPGEYTLTLQVNCIPNQPPVITPSHTSETFSMSPVAIDNGLTVSDDGTTLTSAVISITSGFLSSEDVLSFTSVAGISGTYNTTTGVLNLSGVASLSDYQTILRSVNYNNTATTPNTTVRVISFSLNDGVLNSADETVNISIGITSPPALSSSITTVSYTSGQLAINNVIAVNDPDNINIVSATVSITSGFSASEDILSCISSGAITMAYNTSTGVLSLSGNASLAAYETALRSIIYENTNAGDRNKTPRTISFIVNDGVHNSNVLATTINLPNQSPVIANAGANPQYVSGALAFASLLTINDGDNATLQSALAVISTAFQSAEDQLLFTNQNGITGSYNNASGILQLSGTATIAQYQAALRTIQYQNTNGGDRNKQDRGITFSVSDGTTSSNLIDIFITIPNLLPSITPLIDPPLYGSGTMVIADQLTLSDADNATLQSADITITSGLMSSEDQLIFDDQNGIIGTFTAASGNLLLTGSAPKSAYQAALRTVRYQNNSTAPTISPRGISISINDGMGSSAPAILSLNINRPPVITSQSAETKAGGQITIDLSAMVIDPDNNLDLSNINSITIISQPESGAIASVVNGNIIVDYSAKSDFTGTDHFRILICDDLNRCVEEEITIHVDAGLVVYNAVSANNDGANDFFYLKYIQPENTVHIYNRWGDKVFEMHNYNNDPGKRFEGYNDHGNALPSGTYYYKIMYSGNLVASGYLSLKR